jgi:hypothetical protein
VRDLEDGGVRAPLVEAGRALAIERTPRNYVDGVLGFLDEFEATRRLWP